MKGVTKERLQRAMHLAHLRAEAPRTETPEQVWRDLSRASQEMVLEDTPHLFTMNKEATRLLFLRYPRGTEVYHVLKANEGGPIRKEVLAGLKQLGITARPVHSHLIGHHAIQVDGGERVQRKAKKIIWGK